MSLFKAKGKSFLCNIKGAGKASAKENLAQREELLYALERNINVTESAMSLVCREGATSQDVEVFVREGEVHKNLATEEGESEY